jgi:hypothetical protein
MLTRPNWLPTGLIHQVIGLIDWVTSPDKGNLKVGIGRSVAMKNGNGAAWAASRCYLFKSRASWRGAQATKQSTVRANRRVDCFASLAMTAEATDPKFRLPFFAPRIKVAGKIPPEKMDK